MMTPDESNTVKIAKREELSRTTLGGFYPSDRPTIFGYSENNKFQNRRNSENNHGRTIDGVNNSKFSLKLKTNLVPLETLQLVKENRSLIKKKTDNIKEGQRFLTREKINYQENLIEEYKPALNMFSTTIKFIPDCYLSPEHKI
jgi:hypothetical protein